MFSSMAMSLNSLDSKTSPHSWHSTNSASSSRATTRTRGCLQIFSMAAGSGGRFAVSEFWFEFIFGSRRSGSEMPVHELRIFYACFTGCQVFPSRSSHTQVSYWEMMIFLNWPSPHERDKCVIHHNQQYPLGLAC